MEYRPRVVADIMQSLYGKTVIVLGQVASVDPSGKKLNLKDCAGQNVMVFLKQPLNGICEIGTWCEAEGKVKGKGAMEAERFEPLDQSLFEKFESELYVQMVKLMASPGTSNNFVIEDKTEHQGVGPEIELITNPGDARSELDAGEESFLNM